MESNAARQAALAARAARRARRHARRASLSPIAEAAPIAAYWGVVYGDSVLALARGARGEHAVHVRNAAAAQRAAVAAPLN